MREEGLTDWEDIPHMSYRAWIWNKLPRIIREWDARWTFYCNWKCFLSNEKLCKGNDNAQ